MLPCVENTDIFGFKRFAGDVWQKMVSVSAAGCLQGVYLARVQKQESHPCGENNDVFVHWCVESVRPAPKMGMADQLRHAITYYEN